MPNTTPSCWVYNCRDITDISWFPEGSYGFVYKITDLTTGRWYIGKKNLYSLRNIKLGKKALAAREDKRSSKKKTICKESDWKAYYGSEPELLKDVQKNGPSSFVRQILCICYSKASLTYEEVRHQFLNSCLESDLCYNGNILGKFFKSNTRQNPNKNI